MTGRRRALLALEDGTSFAGWACGADGTADGEAVFNTSMAGYQEVLTDPSYAGQIVTMTMPHIGNYGVNGADMESRGVFARGFVVREMSRTASNWRSEQTLPEFLRHHGVVAIEGVDTRRLTRHLRERGAMRAVISTEDLDASSLAAKAAASPGLVGRDLVREVAVTEPYEWGREDPTGCLPVDTGVLPLKPRYFVAAFDSGIKFNILRQLSESGCGVTVVPPTTTAEEVRAMRPDGVFLANGPGDPAAVDYLYGTLAELLGTVPVFGICLGHQMLSLALGASTYKLKYGHRGGNHPVMNLMSGQVEITSQNHGFCVDFGSIGPLDSELSGGLAHDPSDLAAWVTAGVAPVVTSERFGPVRLTHVNLNDMTVEGVQALDQRAFSVQYHPEAAPGPHDARYLFAAFGALMDGERDYLTAAASESGGSMIGAVLVPADFTADSGLVMRFAAGLGELGVRRVVVGHVVGASGLEAPAVAAMVDEARERMHDMAAPIVAAGIELEIRIGSGEPERELLRLAASSGADAIVVGTHARSIPGEFFVGSVSERIARESVIPVMLVRYELLRNAAEPAEMTSTFARKLLVGTDFSPSAERALALALALPRRAVGAVRLVTVASSEAGEIEAGTELDAVAADARAKGLPVSCGVLRGAPERELLAEIDEVRASGVLVGTRGRHLLAEALLGSVSMAVVRQASCPVLIVP